MSDPLIAWQRLRAGNERIVEPVRGHRSGLVQSRPVAAVFRCADAGVASEMVLGQSWGSLIEVSTWGHMVDSAVIASLEYAVDTLRAPLIVVLGHQDCGAMRTALRAWNEADMPTGAARLMVEQAMGSIVRRAASADSVETVACAHIVETGLGLLERSPVIARYVNAGRCGIVCAATNSGDGRLRAYATVGAVGEVSDTLMECV
jgi:carbonic anhydrase